MRIIKKIREAVSLFFNVGVSRSDSSPVTEERESSPSFIPSLGVASYPALRTAVIIASEPAVPSTPVEWVRRFTEQEVTPSTSETAFSTRAVQAAQLIPVIVYCSIMKFAPSFSFCMYSEILRILILFFAIIFGIFVYSSIN